MTAPGYCPFNTDEAGHDYAWLQTYFKNYFHAALTGLRSAAAAVCSVEVQ